MKIQAEIIAKIETAIPALENHVDRQGLIGAQAILADIISDISANE